MTDRNPTSAEWIELAKAALTAAKLTLRAATEGEVDKSQLHSSADYVEAILDQAPLGMPIKY